MLDLDLALDLGLERSDRSVAAPRRRFHSKVAAALLAVVVPLGATGCDSLVEGLPGRDTVPETPLSEVEEPIASTVAPAPPTTAPTVTGVPVPQTTGPGGTLPVYQQELILTNDGLGTQPFGSDPETVVKYVSSVLGSPTEDTGWLEATERPECPGTMVRIVNYGVLSIQFSDASPIKESGEHFIGWSYGSVREIGESPDGLRTDLGVGLGTPLSEVLAAYPGASVVEGDAETAFPDAFFVETGLWGMLSGPTPDDVVTRLASEYGCGD